MGEKRVSEETTTESVETPEPDGNNNGMSPWMIFPLLAFTLLILVGALWPSSPSPQPEANPEKTGSVYETAANTENVPMPALPLTGQELQKAVSVAKEVAGILGNTRIDATEKERQIGTKAQAPLIAQPELILVDENDGGPPSIYTPIVTSMTARSAQINVPTTVDVYYFDMWKNDEGNWVVVDVTSKLCQDNNFCALDYQSGGQRPEGFGDNE